MDGLIAPQLVVQEYGEDFEDVKDPNLDLQLVLELEKK